MGSVGRAVPHDDSRGTDPVNAASTAAASRVLSDRYVLHERMGVGSAGETWRGRDRVLQRRVAVKLLDPEVVDDPTRARFRAEATAAAKLIHPQPVNLLTTRHLAPFTAGGRCGRTLGCVAAGS
jgi:serine/threonine protein kinase